MLGRGGHRPSFSLLLEELWYASPELQNFYLRDTIDKGEVSLFDSRAKIGPWTSCHTFRKLVIGLSTVVQRRQGRERTRHWRSMNQQHGH